MKLSNRASIFEKLDNVVWAPSVHTAVFLKVSHVQF
jgi:hypothetical protein